MNIEKMLEYINRELPAHAEEMWSAIDLLSNTIENTRCAIDGALGKLSSDREYSKASEYMQMSQELAEVLDIIREYNKKYVLIEDEAHNVPTEDEEDEELENSGEKINYENYRVNEEVSYNLYTDFTHKKPAAFSLEGKKYPARKWQYVFMQTCEILAQKDAMLFSTFVNDDTMQGRTRIYFSTERDEIRKPKKIKGTNIFVETNLSANNIRNIIVNMLERYNISKNQYQIYLSKDLTPLHITDKIVVQKEEDNGDLDEESHISRKR